MPRLAEPDARSASILVDELDATRRASEWLRLVKTENKTKRAKTSCGNKFLKKVIREIYSRPEVVRKGPRGSARLSKGANCKFAPPQCLALVAIQQCQFREGA
jgi:hypothetical protein